MLTDPRGRSLAKLCVMCLMALYKLRSYTKGDFKLKIKSLQLKIVKHMGTINFAFACWNWIHCWIAETSASSSPAKRGKKRARADYELDGMDEICDDLRPPSKMRKLPGQEESPVQNESLNFAGLSIKYYFKSWYSATEDQCLKRKTQRLHKTCSTLPNNYFTSICFRYFSQQRWRKPIE